MLREIGGVGVGGVALVVFGLALVSRQDPVIGAGLMLVVAGLALVGRGIADRTLELFGMK